MYFNSRHPKRVKCITWWLQGLKMALSQPCTRSTKNRLFSLFSMVFEKRVFFIGFLTARSTDRMRPNPVSAHYRMLIHVIKAVWNASLGGSGGWKWLYIGLRSVTDETVFLRVSSKQGKSLRKSGVCRQGSKNPDDHFEWKLSDFFFQTLFWKLWAHVELYHLFFTDRTAKKLGELRPQNLGLEILKFSSKKWIFSSMSSLDECNVESMYGTGVW